MFKILKIVKKVDFEGWACDGCGALCPADCKCDSD